MLTAAIGVGLVIWQRNSFADERSQLQAKINRLEEQLNAKEVITTENEAKAGNTIVPVVVFNPRGLFSDSLVEEFRNKIINPITLYAHDNGNQVNSFFIETSQVEGEYSVNVIYVDGSYEAFLTGGENGIKWVPECMSGCNFSDTFRDKYPDIVRQAEGAS